MSDTLLLVNQVIHDMEHDFDYRLLWTETSDDRPSYWLRLTGNANVPEKISLHDISTGIEEGRYTFAPDLWKPVNSSDAGQTALRLRDNAWELIRSAVSKEPDIYDSKKRRKILLEIESATGTKVPNLYKYLGKYWRYGKVPDALLPDYAACGKRRDPYKDSSKRSGRKKVPGAAGKKLTVSDLKNFRDAFTKYYLGEEKLSLEKTYLRLISDHYTVKDKNGNSVAPMDPDEVPSRQQFFYWHRRNRDTLDEALSRNGQRSYQLKNRGEVGKTETNLRGPGMACQIDATTADIYLVSRDDRTAIIGRPTMYFQMDSFSHIVTGMNISLDPPSWENAARTILNSVEDKVEYCARYGVTITEDEWPCMHFPTVILADRGEVESRTADLLCKHLGITVENAPPYRGDLKGIIEKHFDLINIDMAGLPGKVEKDFRQRCARDYRLDSALDLYEFTAIIIRCVLQYNNYHYMEAFRKTPQMRQLHVKPIPRDIWNFGIRYMSGGLRTMDREQVRYHLLPKCEASVTRFGIHFDGRYYSCEQAEREKWYDTARTDSSWKVTAAYDPRDAALIYITPVAGASPIECRLLDKDRIYQGTSTEEAQMMAAFDHEEQASYAPTEDFHRVQLEEFIEKTKTDALAKLPEKPGKSNAARISEIESNRHREKESIRGRNTAETLKRQGMAPVTETGTDDDNAQTVSPITKMLQEALDKALKGGTDGT